MARSIVTVLTAVMFVANFAGAALGEGAYDWGGWVSTGIYANAWGADDNGPIGTKSIANGATVQQVWGFAEKAVDTGGCGWDYGGRVDCAFGTDAPYFQAFEDGSWDADWNTSDDYGTAMPQLFGEIGYGDVRVKAGRFLTPIGWEAIEDPPNFFSSNSYSYFYGEPATHTGALATWEATDSLTFLGGWSNGWDAGFTDNGGASTYLAGVTWSEWENLTTTYSCSAGRLGDGEGDLYMHSLALEIQATERLAWILHNDLGIQTNGSSGSDALWVGVVQYLQYDLTDCLATGLRFEWFQDRDGARVAPGKLSGNFYALTAGLNWRPIEHLIVRPEIRYDWFGGRYVPGSLPFNDGAKDEQVSGGVDVIVTF